MKQLTIALDVDGVLQDCNSHIRQIAQNVLNRPLPPAADHKHFEFDKSLGLTQDEWNCVASVVCDSTPTLDMDWYDGATGFVDDLLKRGHDVFFLTAHWRGCESWVRWRENRLRMLWPDCDVVFAHNKARCQFDLLLDDKTENVRAAGNRGVLFAQPWNAHATVADYWERVRNYEEFLTLVDKEAAQAAGWR